jgi:hypothetical protein
MADPNLEDFADLIKSVRKSRKLGKWTYAMSDLQRYWAFARMRNRANVDIIPTYSHEWDINMSTAGNARSQSTLTSDTTAQTPTMQTAYVNLRHQQTSYTYTRDQLMANGMGTPGNAAAQKLWNFIQKERVNAWVDLAELMEGDFWGTPTHPTTDTTTPYGLLYGLCTSTSGAAASTGAGGFLGTVPNANFTTVYNVNPTTYPRHANWTHQYVNVTRDDLIYKMKRGAYKTRFRPPVKAPTNPAPGDVRTAFYTNFAVSNEIENKLEDRNENLGTDLAKFQNKAHLKSAPIEVVPKLDADTNNPVYQVDWAAVEIKYLKGFHFNESDPKVNGDKHNVLESFVDAQWGIAIEDRRRLAAYTL